MARADRPRPVELPPSQQRHRRRLIVTALGLAALMLALGLLWRLSTAREEPAGVLAAAPPGAGASAARGSSPGVTGLWQLAARASAEADAAEAGPQLSPAEAEQLARQQDARWCAQGKRLQEQEAERGRDHRWALQADGSLRPPLDPGTETTRLLKANEAVRQRWIGELERRGDERSRALAAHLQGQASGDWTALQRLGARTQDGFVLALARRPDCPPEQDCAWRSARRWTAIDPGNAQAWLERMNEASAAGPESRAELLQGLIQARQMPSLEREVAERLLGLSGVDMPGLRDQAELQVLLQAARLRPPRLQGLASACADSEGDAQLASRCALAAEALWQADNSSVLQRAELLELAQRLPGGQDARWAERRTTLEQVKAAQLAMNSSFDGATDCAWTQRVRQVLREQTTLGEWQLARRLHEATRPTTAP